MALMKVDRILVMTSYQGWKEGVEEGWLVETGMEEQFKGSATQVDSYG